MYRHFDIYIYMYIYIQSAINHVNSQPSCIQRYSQPPTNSIFPTSLSGTATATDEQLKILDEQITHMMSQFGNQNSPSQKQLQQQANAASYPIIHRNFSPSQSTQHKYSSLTAVDSPPISPQRPSRSHDDAKHQINTGLTNDFRYKRNGQQDPRINLEASFRDNLVWNRKPHIYPSAQQQQLFKDLVEPRLANPIVRGPSREIHCYSHPPRPVS